MIHVYSGITLSNKKELCTDTYNEPQKHYAEFKKLYLHKRVHTI